MPSSDANCSEWIALFCYQQQYAMKVSLYFFIRQLMGFPNPFPMWELPWGS